MGHPYCVCAVCVLCAVLCANAKLNKRLFLPSFLPSSFFLLESTGRRADIIAALERVPLLKELTSRQLGVLSRAVSLKTYTKGEAIIRIGEVGDCFYMVRHGAVQVCLNGY